METIEGVVRREQRIENSAEQNKQKSEMVIVLGASLNETRHGQYENFPLHVKGNPKANLEKDGEPVEVVGGDARQRAVVQYVKKFKKDNPDKNINIFTVGGVEQSGKSRAKEMRKKLIVKHKLDRDMVHALPSTGSTFGNARALAEWAKNHPDKVGKLKKIKILTNGFHAMRAWAMFTHALHEEYLGKDLANEMSDDDKKKIEKILTDTLEDQIKGDMKALRKIQQVYAKYLENDPIKVDVIIAENMIALSGEPAHQKYAKLLRTDSLVQQARINERKGLNDLLAGKYRVR